MGSDAGALLVGYTVVHRLVAECPKKNFKIVLTNGESALAHVTLADKQIWVWPSDKRKRLTLERREVSDSYRRAEAFFAQRERG